MTKKEIEKVKASLPKWDEQNEEEKKLDRELDCREMINSILIYGYLNSTIDGIYEDKYLRNYKKDISEDRIKELIKEQQDDLKKSKIFDDVYTDDEGVTYNSVSWYDEEDDIKEEGLFNKKVKDDDIDALNKDLIDINAKALKNESKELRKYNSRLYGIYDTEKEEYVDTGTLDEMKVEVEAEKEGIEELKEPEEKESKDININVTIKNESKEEDLLNGTEEMAIDYAIDSYKREPRDIEEIVHEAVNYYNNGNAELEYENEDFYEEEADYEKVLKIVKAKLGLNENVELGDNVHNLPEYEFRALRYAETYSIIDYTVDGNKMTYVEKLPNEGNFKHIVDLDTMKELSVKNESLSSNNIMDELNRLHKEFNPYKDNANDIKKEVKQILQDAPDGTEMYRVTQDTSSGWTSHGSYSDTRTVIKTLKKYNGVWEMYGTKRDIDDAVLSILFNSGELMSREDAEKEKEKQMVNDKSSHRDIINIGTDSAGDPVGKSINRVSYPNKKEESLSEESINLIINPEDKFYKDGHLFKVLLYPGAGVEMIPYYVYADYEQDALEILIPYLEENALGLLVDIEDLEDEDLDNYITVDGINYLDYNTQIEELFDEEKAKVEDEFFKNYKEEE